MLNGGENHSHCSSISKTNADRSKLQGGRQKIRSLSLLSLSIVGKFFKGCE